MASAPSKMRVGPNRASDPLDARPRLPVRAVAMRDAFGDPGYQRILADPGFNAIPYDSPLTWLMRQIMGAESFCYPLKLPRLVYPCSVVPRQPGNIVHKDFGAVQDMLTCWVPLQAIPTQSGWPGPPARQPDVVTGPLPPAEATRARLEDHPLRTR